MRDFILCYVSRYKIMKIYKKPFVLQEKQSCKTKLDVNVMKTKTGIIYIKKII